MMVLLLSTGIYVNAENTSNQISEEKRIDRQKEAEKILNTYHEKASDMMQSTYGISENAEYCDIAQETVALLNAEGYAAYEVNEKNYNDVQSEIGTNLGDLGLKPQYSYIIAIEEGNTEQETQTRASAGSPYYYTYNGTTYMLRNLLVTSADDPAMYKNSTANLMTSASLSVIENCLNSAVYAYGDWISGPLNLGTVASLCGLTVFDFSTKSDSTLILFAATTWTRMYTQVWSTYDGKWLNGSMVEYVHMLSKIEGTYYDAELNRGVFIEDNKESSGVRYSTRYNDIDWRNERAVIGYLNSFCQSNATGNIDYKHDGKIRITHYENF